MSIKEYTEGVTKHGRCHQSSVYFGYTRQNGSHTQGSQPCHAILGKIRTFNITDIYTSLCYNNEGIKSLAKEFWEFILDARRSPWRGVLGGSTIIRGDDGYPIGVHLSGRNQAQTLGNLCIATRIPTENHNTLLTWKAYKDAGFDDYEALACANLLTKVGPSTQLTSKWNHYPFNVGQVSLKRLRDGDPSTITTTLFLGGSYTPSNSIWNRTSANPLNAKVRIRRTYAGALKKLFINTTGRDYHPEGCVSFAKSVDIFMQERDQL